MDAGGVEGGKITTMDISHVEGGKVSFTDIFRTKNGVHRNLVVLSWFSDNEDGHQSRGRQHGVHCNLFVLSWFSDCIEDGRRSSGRRQGEFTLSYQFLKLNIVYT
ncbi:hypothetical protein OS493_028530 [Desmophyllum pertusum]|uniref:Uncharacterized protein n=1 Tax=Desmophyllum pertusum TaxID=174260 RepID=A0A9X0CVG9_9CNID|nr:hypothetical protein OS493_028530 [Desmophyllum pertusum]